MIFGETYLGAWFIHALWIGMAFVYWLSKKNKYLSIFLGTLFFVLALLDTSYKYVLIDTDMVSGTYDLINNIIYPSESFFVAIPYLLIGKYIADSHHSNEYRKYLLWLLFTLALLLVEAWLCKYACGLSIESINNPRFEVYFCLPLVVYCLVKLSLSFQIPITVEISKYLRNMSILIYLSHRPLMIFIHKTGINPEGMLFFVVTILASSVVSWGVIYLSKRINFLKMFY